VVVSVVLRGRIRAADQEVAAPVTQVWRFRDGKAIEIRDFRTQQAALEALEADVGG
jgi:ketosteroid isomerase-like protein